MKFESSLILAEYSWLKSFVLLRNDEVYDVFIFLGDKEVFVVFIVVIVIVNVVVAGVFVFVEIRTMKISKLQICWSLELIGLFDVETI